MSNMLDRETLREPYFLVAINGKRLSPEQHQRITEVMVEDSVEEGTLGRVTIHDSDFYFVNDSSIATRSPIQIYMGHKGKYRLMLQGKITHIEPDFQEDGIPMVTIGAVGETINMSGTKKTRTWKNKKISEVITEIAKSYGWKTDVQDSKTKYPQISQKNESDLQFIERLKKQLGWIYHLPTKGAFYFGVKKSEGMPAKTLEYYSGECSIISFSFQYDNTDTATSEKSSDISTEGKTEQDTQKDTSKAPKKAGGKTTVSTTTGAVRE